MKKTFCYKSTLINTENTGYKLFRFGYKLLRSKKDTKPKSAAQSVGCKSVTASPVKYQYNTLHLSASKQSQYRKGCFTGL